MIFLLMIILFTSIKVNSESFVNFGITDTPIDEIVILDNYTVDLDEPNRI